MASRHAFILTVFLVVVLFASTVYAQVDKPVIKEIKYEGLFRTRENLIAYKIRSEAGKLLSHEILVEDQKRLIEAGYFQDVTVRTEPAEDGVILVFTFREKPILQDVILTGNRNVKSSKLLKKVYDKVGRGEIFNELEFYDAIIEIEEFYHKKGYHDIAVTHKPEADIERNEITVEIIIDEGERGFVKKITLIGVESVPKKTVLKSLETKRRKPIPWLFGKGELKRDVLKEDESRIKALYNDHGFLDARVVEVKLEAYGKKGIYLELIITVEEGEKYVAGDIELRGNNAYSTEELTEKALLNKGDVLSIQVVDRERQRLSDFYSEKGYIDIRVRHQFVPTDQPNVLNVVYVYREGPRVRLGKIEITGNITTKDKVIRRELAMTPGELYDGLKLRASISRLRQLYYFSRVDIYPVETDEADVRDLIVEVEETNTGKLVFGVGFSSIDKLVGTFEVTQSNFDYKDWPTFRGAGQKARLRAGFGSERQDYLLSFTEPWLFDRRLSFSFDIFKQKKKYVSNDYDQDAYGFRLRLFKKLFKQTRGGVTYKWQNVDIDPDEDASELILAEEGDRTTSSLKFQIINDTTNSRMLPSRGWYTDLSFEYAGGFLGGDTEFTREGIEIKKYTRLFGGHVVKLLVRYGTMEEFGDTESIPIFERFFLGGRTTVRGYDFRDIGPKDRKGEPLGGKSTFMFSAEYLIPIFEDLLRGAVFYDMGNVWEESNEIDLDDLRAGWGIGLRIIIPQMNLPVNLDYSWPLDPDEFTEDEGRFDFSLGFDF